MAPCAGVDVGPGRTEIRELLVSWQQVQQVQPATMQAVQSSFHLPKTLRAVFVIFGPYGSRFAQVDSEAVRLSRSDQGFPPLCSVPFQELPQNLSALPFPVFSDVDQHCKRLLKYPLILLRDEAKLRDRCIVVVLASHVSLAEGDLLKG